MSCVAGLRIAKTARRRIASHGMILGFETRRAIKTYSSSAQEALVSWSSCRPRLLYQRRLSVPMRKRIVYCTRPHHAGTFAGRQNVYQHFCKVRNRNLGEEMKNGVLEESPKILATSLEVLDKWVEQKILFLLLGELGWLQGSHNRNIFYPANRILLWGEPMINSERRWSPILISTRGWQKPLSIGGVHVKGSRKILSYFPASRRKVRRTDPTGLSIQGGSQICDHPFRRWALFPVTE